MTLRKPIIAYYLPTSGMSRIRRNQFMHEFAEKYADSSIEQWFLSSEVGFVECVWVPSEYLQTQHLPGVDSRPLITHYVNTAGLSRSKAKLAIDKRRSSILSANSNSRFVIMPSDHNGIVCILP